MIERASAEADPTTTAPGTDRRAELWLVVATALWGVSFALAKEGGSELNRAAGAGEGSPFGPTMLLALRFAVAAVAWAVLVPAARRGWTRRGVGLGALLGGALASGLVVQHAALELADEASVAFLTSTAALWVPWLTWCVWRVRPRVGAWLAIALATPGAWLISQAGGLTGGVGAALGIACALLFAVHLVLMNWCVPRDAPGRMMLAQLVLVGVACGIVSAAWGTRMPWPEAERAWGNVVMRDVLWLVAGPTLLAFGLMTRFQPRVTPMKAVLIYLLEPVFAAVFAFAWRGSGVTRGMVAGAALIVLANVVAEGVTRRRERGDEGTGG